MPMPLILRPLAALAIALTALPALAQSFDTAARAAYILDQTTGTELLAKNAEAPLPPASMSKLMTIYMTFEALADGRLHPDDELPVSQHAMDYQGSSMFLRSGERVKVSDLIRGVIVLSGNDASAVLAEALSPDGTEIGFAHMMTERARQLGMMNSTFMNSNGWPVDGHRMSMHDLAILADHIISDYPTYYPIFAEQEFHFDGRVPSNSQNRNPILGLGYGADGLKTGHTAEAGYGMVGSAQQGNRRVIFVISGLDSAEARAAEAEKILNWSFRAFREAEVARAGTKIAEAQVWMGQAASVGLTVSEDVDLLIPALSQSTLSAEVVYDTPVNAPVHAGDVMGELVITLPELPERRVPLVAMGDVAPGGFKVKLETAIKALFTKFFGQEATEAGA